MTNYNPGDVILVNIAFSGAVGYKRRPAVIISKDSFNTAGIKLVVAAITSFDTHNFFPLQQRLIREANFRRRCDLE